MADRKKSKKKKEEFALGNKKDEEKVPKIEYTVAKWLKSNVPSKKIKFMNHHVEYFTGARAADALLTSKWATGDSALFTDRVEVINFLNQMLIHKFFHRAKKVPVSEQELKSRSKKKDGDKEEPKKKNDDNQAEQKDKEEKEKEQRKKRKIRLDIHMDQVFVDGSEAYVWMYDPIPFYYWIFGGLLVLGAIGICLFPLWPSSVRKGVYYVSVFGAVFLAFIIALTTLRFIIFSIVWAVSLSKHHFWILPNLTEDVGFFASFWPLYQYEYRGNNSKDGKNDKNKKKKKKAKYSDEEPEGENSPLISEHLQKHSSRESQEDYDGDDKSNENEKTQSLQENTESESEGSQRSSTGKDFEMVDADDVDSS